MVPPMPLPAPDAPLPDAVSAAWKFDPRRHARSLYWRGWGVTQIADEFALHAVTGDKGKPIARATIESWKQRDDWDDAPSIRKIEDGLEIRLLTLIAKDRKTPADLVEMDALARQIESLARVRRFAARRPQRRPQREGRQPQRRAAQEGEEEPLHRRSGRRTEADLPRRLLRLPAGLVGCTGPAHAHDPQVAPDRGDLLFAFEALIDAIETGRNQIFLSASKAQAHQFRSYIVSFAKLVGVALTGDPMLITSDLRPAEEAAAELHFLGTNFRTAQGRHGNFYFDEFFWVHSFEELNKVASGMATHKKWRKTYFSTPSSVAHPAYPYWTGERRNRRRKKEDRVEIDVSRAALALAAPGRTGSGATSSTSRTPRRAAATCSTSTNCATNMPPTNLPTCSCASSSTIPCRRSASTT
jgi:uncharacterized protein YjcR